mmetsp:Transcript_32834/g.74117  ORF Transcript_32834/g.74117 Transcript_32834/m.74117 type:complete len:207 (+) Transcript_32834:877-1497(+)
MRCASARRSRTPGRASTPRPSGNGRTHRWAPRWTRSSTSRSSRRRGGPLTWRCGASSRRRSSRPGSTRPSSPRRRGPTGSGSSPPGPTPGPTPRRNRDKLARPPKAPERERGRAKGKGRGLVGLRLSSSSKRLRENERNNRWRYPEPGVNGGNSSLIGTWPGEVEIRKHRGCSCVRLRRCFFCVCVGVGGVPSKVRGMGFLHFHAP